MIYALLALAAVQANPVPIAFDPPGALNPAVTQENIATTICVRHWATDHRPDRKLTWKFKRALLHTAHLDGKSRRYVLDHPVSIELGGAPLDGKNFMLQTIKEGKMKDWVEGFLNRRVCAGTETLASAQVRVLDWRPVYTANHGKKVVRHRHPL